MSAGRTSGPMILPDVTRVPLKHAPKFRIGHRSSASPTPPFLTASEERQPEPAIEFLRRDPVGQVCTHRTHKPNASISPR